MRVKGLPENATLKWVPTYDAECIHYSGGVTSGSVTKDGRPMPELRAYIASFRRGRMNCVVQIQFAAGPWKTEASDTVVLAKGASRSSRTGINSILASSVRTIITAALRSPSPTTSSTPIFIPDWWPSTPKVTSARPTIMRTPDARGAHSFVNHFGEEHPANYSSRAGDQILSMLDTEFLLPYDQIKGFRFQSRPFERAEIEDIALQPRLAGK